MKSIKNFYTFSLFSLFFSLCVGMCMCMCVSVYVGVCVCVCVCVRERERERETVSKHEVDV